MSSFIVRLTRTLNSGEIVNNAGQNCTLRVSPFSVDTVSLSALPNESGFYYGSITDSDDYKLFVNGVEETSIGADDGFYIATKNANGWEFDKINSVRLSSSSNNVIIGTDISDSNKFAVLGNASITGNLYISGNINAPALSSLTSGISFNQYTLTSSFISATSNLQTGINSLSTNQSAISSNQVSLSTNQVSLSSTVGNLNRFTLTSSFISATASLTGGTLLSKTSSQIYLTNSSDNLRLGNSTLTGYKLDVQGLFNVGNSSTYGTSGDKGRITWGGSPQSFNIYALSSLNLAFGVINVGEIITVASAGNVGINTTTPNTKFSVNGDVSTTGNFTCSTASNRGIFVLSSGRVGINQSAPAQALEVSGSLICGMSFSLGKGSPSASLGYAFNRDFPTGNIYDSSRYAFQFTRPQTADRLDTEVYNGSGTLITSRAFTVDSLGFIGMGTNSPSTRLHVVGHQTLSGGLIRTQLPDNSVTSSQSQTTQVNTYMKGSFYVIAFNDAGTMKYRYLNLTGTDANWTYSTTAP